MKKCSKKLKSILKIFLQNYGPNHVWYSITRTKHKDWYRFNFEYFLDASDIYRVQVIPLSKRYSGLDHCLKMCRSLFYIRVINYRIYLIFQSILAALVAEWLRPLIFSALNRSSSHRCGFEPSSGHMRQVKFCLRVVRWFFSWSHVFPQRNYWLGSN